MPLKPEVSLGMAAATAAVVYGIYSQATPTIADIRVAQPNDEHITSAERAATWTAAAVVGGVSLIAKDPTIFIVGGAMIVVMAWWTRHANTVNPLLNAASMEGAQQLPVEPSDDVADDYSGYEAA